MTSAKEDATAQHPTEAGQKGGCCGGSHGDGHAPAQPAGKGPETADAHKGAGASAKRGGCCCGGK